MAAPQKSRAKQKAIASLEERQQRFDFIMFVWDRTCTMVTNLAITATVAWSIYAVCYLPLTVAPGETTAVSGVFSFAGDIGVRTLLPWGLAGISIYWGYREKTLRMDERKTKDERIRELELRIDPSVSSSGTDLSGRGIGDKK